jgi:hypothetical protein
MEKSKTFLSLLKTNFLKLSPKKDREMDEFVYPPPMDVIIPTVGLTSRQTRAVIEHLEALEAFYFFFK